MFHAQLHQGADKSAVVPCMLQVCMVACLAPFCHVQAHFVGSAFPPVFLLFHFWAVCGQFFFSMALFESCGTSCTGNVLNHSPKPKATCPPMVWWLSILIGFAPLCRGGVHHACKGRAHGGSCCGMFKVPRKQNSTAGPRALWVVLGGTQCCRGLWPNHGRFVASCGWPTIHVARVWPIVFLMVVGPLQARP